MKPVVTGIAMPALLADLYDEKPTRTLYHSTSLHGLQGIVESRSMWATEIRYLSDAKELVQTLEIFLSAIRIRSETSDAIKRELFRQLETWLRDRLVGGHLVFISSFTEEGNLLSQWRGYSPLGQGVSLGFDPQNLRKVAQEQAYQLGKCVYDHDLQRHVVQRILEQIENEATTGGPETDRSKRHPSNSYYALFEKFEDDLLLAAALLKNSAFREEVEWRLVSSVVKRYAPSDIRYREGRFCLVPYRELSLVTKETNRMMLKEVYVGPTPNPNLSMRSVSMYLSQRGLNAMVANSMIPYRAV